MMRHRWVLVLVLGLACASGPAMAQVATDDRIGRNLEWAGENAAVLQGFLDAYEGERRAAAEFLVANMPAGDLAVATPELLRGTVDYAFRAREELAWAREVPWEVFLHFVLPYRVAEERLDPWRGYFYERLAPRFRGLEDAADVAHGVNLWLGRCPAEGLPPRVRFVQTEFRDQGPLETLRGGTGRCEEMMVTYIAAARSLGIPARSVWTPWWATGDNNHAWVEVWAEGQWYPLGGCEPGGDPRLRSTWFSGRAERAAAIRAACFGRPATAAEGRLRGETIDAAGENFAILDTTGLYSRTGVIEAVATRRDGSPAAGVPVTASVFNYGGLRVVDQGRTGPGGVARLRMGIGGYFLAAGDGPERAWAVVQTVADGTVRVEMVLGDGPGPEGDFWLRYPTPAEAAHRPDAEEAVPAGGPPEGPGPDLAALALDPAEVPADVCRAARFDPDREEFVSGHLREHLADPGPALGALGDAAGNWHELAEALVRAGPEGIEDMAWLLSSLAHLDRLAATAEALLEHVREARAARGAAAWELPDDLYRGQVLAVSMGSCHFSAWRGEARRRFGDLAAADRRATALGVNRRVASTLARRGGGGGRFAPPAPPEATLRAGGGSDHEVALATVAALRALAVPARESGGWVEFHDGTGWLPLYPHDPDHLGDRGRDAAASARYVEPARLVPRLIRGGRPDEGRSAWALSRWGGASWEPLRQLDAEGDAVRVEPGDYLLTAGLRNRNGDAYVRCLPLRLASGERREVEVALDPPYETRREVDLLVRPLAEVPDLGLPLEDGTARRLSTVLAEGRPVVLAFFTTRHEPCIRMIPLVAAVRGARVVAVCTDEGGAAALRADGRLADLGVEFWFDPGGREAARFIPDLAGHEAERLPSVLLLSGGPASRAVYWCEGYDLNVGSDLGSALEALSRAAAQPARRRAY